MGAPACRKMPRAPRVVSAMLWCAVVGLVDAGRRGGLLRTTGTFALNQGGNTAGNEELGEFGVDDAHSHCAWAVERMRRLQCSSSEPECQSKRASVEEFLLAAGCMPNEGTGDNAPLSEATDAPRLGSALDDSKRISVVDLGAGHAKRREPKASSLKMTCSEEEAADVLRAAITRNNRIIKTGKGKECPCCCTRDAKHEVC